ncbi:hypothetical protein ACSBR1_024484 [Camellia fascicularis]
MGLLVSCTLFLFMHVIFVVMVLMCLGSSSPHVHVVGSIHGGNETDRLALLAFKEAITIDPTGALNSWNDNNESIHFCQWVGVTCGRRHQRVTVLDLDHRKLAGSISPHIGNLSFLRKRSLRNNSLVNKIPPELGRLWRLQELSFLNNSISGIPSTLGNLSSLMFFYATYDNINGNIPDTLGRLTNLMHLALAVNKLAGTVPSSIYNLSSITIFDIGMNQIQGNLPLGIGIALPNLEWLAFGPNLFAGSIPISISNATKLYYLDFGSNKFIGKVPPLENMHNLVWLNFQNNHLGAEEADDLNFLNSLANATNLNTLGISENNFGGELPESSSNLSINLGNIPADIGKLQNLQFLILSYNQFHGEIPSLENLTLLTNLYLEENKFYGSIPSLGKCPLVELNLGGNNLIGTIPQGIISLSSLLYLNLSQNRLDGFLQMEIGNLINFEQLDVSGNMFFGEIPSTLSSCVELTLLCIQGNNFSGTLPSSLSHLRGIEKLDFSHNNFSRKILDYLEGFVFLQTLNLSFNDFEGAVPESDIFKNATSFSVEGNNKLCGGIPELQLRSCNTKGFKTKRFTLTFKLIILTLFGLLALFLLLCFLYFCWFRKSTKVPSFRFSGNSYLKLSYQNLLKATDGFSPTNLIGAGSFGSVYKGILDQGERVVALKVLNLLHRGASRSFVAECEALRRIRHRNLVKIFTVCSSVDYNGNDFKALEYEFMVNGSLEEWLLPNENQDEVHLESRNLNLLQRLNISIDVASALDYLHHHSTKPIVHCDLKPSNVLLNNEMIGHVGDFGLARFLPEDIYNSSAIQSSFRGSIGYVAPEYGIGNEVLTFGDVYSYGILLLEMFTIKRPTDSMFNDGLSLHSFVQMALPELVATVADPTLLQQREMGEASSSTNNTRNQSSHTSHKIHECLISIFNIGIACSQEAPRNRPTISHVVTQLHAIKNNLIGRNGVRGSRRARIAV